MGLWTVALCVLVEAIYFTHKLEEDFYLTEKETAVIDVSELFAGDLVDIELRSESPHISLQSSTEVIELSTVQAAFSLGPTFLREGQECFSLYNCTTLQVWCLYSSRPTLEWETPTTGPIEDIQYVETEFYSGLIYVTIPLGTHPQVFVLDPYPFQMPQEVRELPLTSKSHIVLCSQVLDLLISERNNNGTEELKHILSLSYSNSQITYIDQFIISDFHVSDIVSLVCTDTPHILAANHTYHTLRTILPLSPIQPVIGTALYLANKGNLHIVTDRGMVGFRKGHAEFLRLRYIKGGKLVTDMENEAKTTFVVFQDKEEILFGIYQFEDFKLSGRVADIRLSLPSTDIRYMVYQPKVHYEGVLLVQTDSVVYIYRVFIGEKTVLFRAGEGSYRAEICAFEHFNRSESLCLSLTVHTLPTDSAVVVKKQCIETNSLHLHIPIDNSLSGSVSLSPYFSGSLLHYSLSPSPLSIRIQPSITPLSSIYRYDLPFIPEEFGCGSPLRSDFKLVFLQSSELTIVNLDNLNIERIKSPYKANLTHCITYSDQVYLSGLDPADSTTIFILLHREIIINRCHFLKFLQAERLLFIVCLEAIYYIFPDSGSMWHLVPTHYNSPILDATVNTNCLCVLYSAHIEIFRHYGKEYYYVGSSEVDAIEVSIIGWRLVLRLTRDRYNIYILTKSSRKLTFLYSVTIQCIENSMKQTISHLIFQCKDSILFLNPQRPYREMIIAEYEMPRDYLVIPYPNSDIVRTVSWAGGEVNVTTWEVGQVRAVVDTDRGHFEQEREDTAGLLSVTSERGTQVTTILYVTLQYVGNYPIPQWTNNTVEVQWSSSLFLSASSLFQGSYFSLSLYSPVPSLLLIPDITLTHYYPSTCQRLSQTTLIPSLSQVLCSYPEKLVVSSYSCERFLCEFIRDKTISTKHFKEVVNRLIPLFSLQQYVILLDNELIRDLENEQIVILDSEIGTLKRLEDIRAIFQLDNILIVQESANCVNLFIFGTTLLRYVFSIESSSTLVVTEVPSALSINVISVSSAVHKGQIHIYVLTSLLYIEVYLLSPSFPLLYTLSLPGSIGSPFFPPFLCGSKLLAMSSGSLEIYTLPNMVKSNVISKLGEMQFFKRDRNWLGNAQMFAISRSNLTYMFDCREEMERMYALPYGKVGFTGGNEGYGVDTKGVYSLVFEHSGVLITPTNDRKEQLYEVQIIANSDYSAPTSVHFTLKRTTSNLYVTISVVLAVGVSIVCLERAKKQASTEEIELSSLQ